MPAMERKPEFSVHIEHPLGFNAFDVKWVPMSSRLVVIGSNVDGTGNLQVLEMSNKELYVISTTRNKHSIKCGTFRGSYGRQLAMGDFSGCLQVVDMNRPDKAIFSVKGHDDIINTIDGIGGMGVGVGPAEIVTGGNDSVVNVWDTRVNKPVVNILPEDGSHRPDCWSVAVGNSYNHEERTVAAGFDNGDIKLFDLATCKVIWETNIIHGVCSLEFDQRSVAMNKLVATTLEGKIYIYDISKRETQNTVHRSCLCSHGSTVWCVKHLPDFCDLFVTTGGNGSVNLWRYLYGTPTVGGAAGNRAAECLQQVMACSQPITSFDWSSTRGLGAFSSIDQTVRVMVVVNVTK